MKIISDANKIVVKIGSQQLVDPKSGNFNTTWLNSLVDEINELRKRGKKVIVVTSGAIALGCNILNLYQNKMKLIDKQAISSVGQYELIKRFKESFDRYDTHVAQLLLTIEDVENRKRYTTARNVINNLLEKNVVPIVNENDVIATAEIRFGDNDRLSARVAQISHSDLLILLASIDGLYSEDPNINKNAHFIKEVYEISSEIEKFSGDSVKGTGGMSAKIAAVKIAMNANCRAIIVNGSGANIIKNLEEGNIRSTVFLHDDNVHVKFIKE